MQKPQLIIGNKNYSSWSLRPWLALCKAGIEFEEIYIPLYSGGFKQRLLEYSPAGKVPIYLDGDTAVWDSLAIAEHLAENSPELWPSDPGQRAEARSISAEMHSGFAALRGAMPMNCRGVGRTIHQDQAITDDINRIQAIWSQCRTRNAASGPWLYGQFSNADAMYAPVVSRFNTYGITGSSAVNDYIQTVLKDPDMQRWYRAAEAESEIIEASEVGVGE